jgi:hypothetical protein
MKIQRISTMLLLCASFVLPSSALAQSEDPTPLPGPTTLTLLNGWTNAPYSTSDAQVEVVNGIVHLKGAIATSGTNNEAFVLPKAFRPAHYVYIPVDLCNANNGRLYIEPDGAVYVESETTFSQAACFTSLDGASFALNGSGFTALKLINGWTNAPYSTSDAEVKNIDGIVHLKGAIATSGTNVQPFVLPKEFRPDSYTAVPVDLCGATNGQLVIDESGEVFVNAETAWSDAQCFTSLDGVWFAAKDNGFEALTVLNGWTSEYDPAVSISQGVVYFQGAIYTSGSNSEPFVLPHSFRPATDVYVQVSLCNSADGNEIANGRLLIRPNGVVSVQSEGAFSEAQCTTSLDGVSFVK